MSTRHRRIIVRPDGVDDAAWSRLGDLLAAAVERQRRLAGDCPHVLAPLSDLRELDDGSLAVAHEPASPTSIADLFNSQAPDADPAGLLRLTADVFAALAAAHGARPGERPASHGGICPGTILLTPDGQTKVADFGFAPAICQALGTNAYVNLAVAPPAATGSQDDEVTGIWEVLDPHTFDRDDRICGFIDPDKYGTRALGTFESGSDIIAAGFVLHLMAEHQHAYLYTDPDAHRLVEMSQFMGMRRYNGARRQDLRESSDPAVRLWCDLIAKTLSRLPKNRPTAAEIVQALSGEADAEQVAAVLEGKTDLRKPQAPATQLQATSTGGKKKLVLAAGIGLAVVIGAIGAWQFWRAEPTPNANVKPAPPATDDGPPDNSKAALDAENQNASASEEVVAIPDSESETPAENAAIIEEGEVLTRKVDRLEERLDRRTHEVLEDIVKKGSIRALRREVHDYWKLADEADALEQSKTAHDQVARLGEWISKIASYEQVVKMAGKSLDEKVQLLEEAHKDWPTSHVKNLIAGLPAVAELLNEADRQLGRGEWRRARFVIAEAEQESTKQKLGDYLAPVISAARVKLAQDRRAQLADAFHDAAELLARIGDPPDPVPHLARTEDAAAARNRLDRFDLDFPTRAAPSEVGAKAVEQYLLPLPEPTDKEQQNLMPWKVLTDEERATLDGLIAWTTFDLPVGGSTVSLVFVQAAPKTGMLDPVWIGQTEVTVGLYREVVGGLPKPPAAAKKNAREAYDVMSASDVNPIAFVAADQVQPFCASLMKMFENQITVQPPSEAQWTQAMSTGGLVGMKAAPQLARFASGAEGPLELDPELANFFSDEGWVSGGILSAPGHEDGFGFCAPVRSYPPNRWLIYDMLGNVSEWVTTTSGMLYTIGGSYVDRYTNDPRVARRRDLMERREEIGIRIVVKAAPLPLGGG